MTGVGAEDIWKGVETKCSIFVGYEMFSLDSSKKNILRKISKICRFDILTAGCLIAQNAETP